MKQEQRAVSECAFARRAAELAAPSHPDTGDAISFDSGYAFPGIFPDLTAASERALTGYRGETLQYGPPFGLPALREWISAYLRDDGAGVTTNEVLVVNGAKGGLELICRLFAEEGDAVVVTAPTYFSAIPILRSFGLAFVEVPQDDEGLDVDALAELLARRRQGGMAPPKFIYDVPDFHNPTGVTMSGRRRETLLDLATALEIPIVEDSPYRMLRFEGESEPSLKALDRANIVLGLGTFSKLLAPGLRIGWISAAPSMLARMARLKSDGGTSPLAQRIVLEFFKAGGLAKQIERARATYMLHRDRMVAALRRELPEAAFAVPLGGYYLWLRFPEGADTNVLAQRAHEAGVSVIAGDAFFAADGPKSVKGRGIPKRYLRLAYSHATPQEIDDGVRILAATYRAMNATR
jgi:2-aminoadipate transaminase